MADTIQELREQLAGAREIIAERDKTITEQAEKISSLQDKLAECADRKKPGRKSKLTKEVIEKIYALRMAFYTIKEIAQQMKLSVGLIWRALKDFIVIDVKPTKRSRNRPKHPQADQITTVWAMTFRKSDENGENSEYFIINENFICSPGNI